MPSFDQWLSGGDERADFDATAIINRDAVEVVFARGNTELAAQTVRIAPSSVRGGGGSGADPNSTPSTADVVIIGDPGLDVKKGDLFVFRGTRYKVAYVTQAMPGQTQARAEGTQ